MARADCSEWRPLAASAEFHRRRERKNAIAHSSRPPDPVHYIATCTTTLASLPTLLTVLRIQCPGVACGSGTVTGANPYEQTSPICLAATHAGTLTTPGQTVTIMPGTFSGYTASTQNGVTSVANPASQAGFSVVATIDICHPGFLCARPFSAGPCPAGTYAAPCGAPGFPCDEHGTAGASFEFRCLVGLCPTRCTACPAGSSCFDGVQATCPAGTYGDGGKACNLCRPGSFAAASNATSWYVCPARRRRR